MRQTLLAKGKRPNSFVALGAVAAAFFFSGADAGAGTELPEGFLALTTSAEPSFAVTLSGYDQTKTYAIPSVLADTRDLGGGWSTTITSTWFKTADGETLPKDASSVTSVANTCRSGGTCTRPRASVSLPVPVPAGQNATPVKYFDSALAHGRRGL